jgi:transcriptional regulator GlxA family with amidase domain
MMDLILAPERTSATSPVRRIIGPRESGIFYLGSRNSLLEWQIRRVREYIDAHIGSRVLVSDLSHIAQRSEARFTRAFERTFGETPHAYLTRLRLELASRVMLATNTPLTDIALTCGFTDQAHLRRSKQAERTAPRNISKVAGGEGDWPLRGGQIIDVNFPRL